MAGLTISGLTNEPVVIQGRWLSKTVTTNAPKLVPHAEYALHYDVTWSSPFVTALILRDARTLEYQRMWRSSASTNANVSLSFMPFDWNHSDKVSISLYQKGPHESGGVQFQIENNRFKADPRPFVDALVLDQSTVLTGTMFDLAVIKASGLLHASIAFIAKGDTESRHGRWRLKPSLAMSLPPSLSFLQHGRLSGTVSL